MQEQPDDLIRRRIREEMAAQGWTQAALARELGVKPPSLAQILSGRRGKVPASLLNVLGALHLTLKVTSSAEQEG